MSDVDDLIKEIAVKHGIAVGRDDPILILQTINQRLMQDSAKAQQAMLDQYKQEMEDLARRWGNDSKNKAERVLNAALAASRDTMGKAMQEGAVVVTETIRREMEGILARMNTALHTSQRFAALNIAVTGVTLLAVLMALWAAFRH